MNAEQREIRSLQNALRALAKAVIIHINALESEMARPEEQVHGRGQRVAVIAKELEMAHDTACHFVLGMSDAQIKKSKAGVRPRSPRATSGAVKRGQS